MDTIKVSCQANCFKLQGALTFDTVMAGWQALQPLCAQTNQPVLCFDLAEISHCDSAGLALLLALLRWAAQHHKTVQFLGFGAQMHKLAKVSGLEALLPILRDQPL